MPNTMTELSQTDIAQHLDTSERNLRDVLKKLKSKELLPEGDWENHTLEEIRIAYIRYLREVAAGRGGEYQEHLVIAKTRKETLSADMIEAQLKRMAGEFVPLSQIEPFITSAVIAAKQAFLNLPSKWAQEMDAMFGIKIEELYFETGITDALNQLSGIDLANANGDGTASDGYMESITETINS